SGVSDDGVFIGERGTDGFHHQLCAVPFDFLPRGGIARGHGAPPLQLRLRGNPRLRLLLQRREHGDGGGARGGGLAVGGGVCREQLRERRVVGFAHREGGTFANFGLLAAECVDEGFPGGGVGAANAIEGGEDREMG